MVHLLYPYEVPEPAKCVFILGLDGATWTNLSGWVERGVMPVLGRLMAEGAYGILNSTIPALTPPAWSSLVTGTNPGKHGIYHFRHTPPGDYYQRRLNTSRDVDAPTIWQRLNTHGKRTGAFNVPMSSPVYPVNGFITSDAFAAKTTEMTTHPTELAQQFPDFLVDVIHYPHAPPGSANYEREMLAFVDENARVLECHGDATVKLMREQSWQFMMSVWLVLDRIQHFGWQYADPAIAPRNPISARVEQLFRQIDRHLGRVLEAAGPQCVFGLVSDHGFGPIPRMFFNTNRWLADRGYLTRKRSLIGALPRAWRTTFGVPIDTKCGLVDWSRTRVWADPLESRAAGLRINRIGKYPEGIVLESEWRALRDQVAQELHQLRAPDGTQVFARIHEAESLYRGPHAEAGPDLVAILAKPYDVPPSFRRDVRAASWYTPNRHLVRDGGHEAEGVVLWAGPCVKRGVRLEPQAIESLVPTVLQLFGLPLARDLDAEPITAALADDFLRACPPHRERSTEGPVTPTQPEYSVDDSATIEERLRNLGYLE
jgi:predicted AlkP superfamily phosphohydrolase/phosphomutase